MDNNAIINLKKEMYIDNIFEMYPNGKIFNFEPGNYYLKSVLHITKPGIQFLGTTKKAADVHIFQKDTTMDGIAINADKIIIMYISVHVPHDDKIALTVASSNDTKIENNYFYGNSTTFTVYYAGPKDLKTGSSTLNAYFKNYLDNRNVFRRNVVYSKWSDDNIAFCLQNGSLFTYNIIRGGKVAAYMCKNTYITTNTIYDSSSNGVYLSFPCDNVQIKYNHIYECSQSAIMLANQLEHGPFKSYPYNILIKDNYIYDAKNNAIEMNDANKISITGNRFVSTDESGIYCLRSTDVNINANKISYFKVAIWLELSSHNSIMNNNVFSVYPDDGNNIVKITNKSNSNVIANNSINGHIEYDLFPVDSDCLNNKIYDNKTSEYYNYDEEFDIMK